MENDRRTKERRQSDRRKMDRCTADRRKIDRRRLIKFGTLATVAGLFPESLIAAVDSLSPQTRSLSFLNIHTGESLSTSYCIEGRYSPEALQEINNILRDHRTGETIPIDTRLLDLLHAIALRLDSCESFHIISGYRSPTTNTMLRGKSKGVAKYSLHMEGKAADIRVPGCDIMSLRRVAMDLKAGGVGFYKRSNFVHVDIGKLRYW